MELLSAAQVGLCLLTTRERIADLREYERSADYPEGALVRHDLGNLSPADGARLLYRLQVRRAGAAAIGPGDGELRQATEEVQGHALTLRLLGGYLARAQGGDIRRRDRVALKDADAAKGGKAFGVMAAYETWLRRKGEPGARELAALRLLGLFERPADAPCLKALRRAPPIAGLTEPLVGLSTAQWNLTLSRLEEGGLIDSAAPEPQSATPSAIDAHPLVREYLAGALREKLPAAWREAHRRLYEHLKGATPQRPEALAGLQPLYQAVAHGCLAGLQQEACDEVYFDRISRGAEAYVVRKLGAFGADLGAVACFFEEPWERPSPALSESDRAWLLSVAAFHLRALGRLSEALEPMRAGLEDYAEQEDWKNAAIVAGNLSELELTLGRVADAVRDAERSGIM